MREYFTGVDDGSEHFEHFETREVNDRGGFAPHGGEQGEGVGTGTDKAVQVLAALGGGGVAHERRTNEAAIQQQGDTNTNDKHYLNNRRHQPKQTKIDFCHTISPSSCAGIKEHQNKMHKTSQGEAQPDTSHKNGTPKKKTQHITIKQDKNEPTNSTPFEYRKGGSEGGASLYRPSHHQPAHGHELNAAGSSSISIRISITITTGIKNCNSSTRSGSKQQRRGHITRNSTTKTQPQHINKAKHNNGPKSEGKNKHKIREMPPNPTHTPSRPSWRLQRATDASPRQERNSGVLPRPHPGELQQLRPETVRLLPVADERDRGLTSKGRKIKKKNVQSFSIAQRQLFEP